MRLPLDVVLLRGVIFLWTTYDKLDDPALAGQTKPKFVVILTRWPLFPRNLEFGSHFVYRARPKLPG